MEIVRNKVIDGPKGKPILLDVFYEQDNSKKPIVIFSHGFKGFKDWGHFNLVAETFAHAGFLFLKYNFSHNGTTPKQPEEFVDPGAFGHNTFTIELNDLNTVINWLVENHHEVPVAEFDTSKIFLLSHSRGGGISILKSKDMRVKKVATWASVNDFGQFWTEGMIKEWKEKGVHHVTNSRTGQELPIYIDLYEDYQTNKGLLSIPYAVKEMQIPFLIVHGTDDESVPYHTGKEMSEWNKNARLLTVEDGNHTFGAKHPWTADRLPALSQHVVEETIRFFKD